MRQDNQETTITCHDTEVSDSSRCVIINPNYQELTSCQTMSLSQRSYHLTVRVFNIAHCKKTKKKILIS